MRSPSIVRPDSCRAITFPPSWAPACACPWSWAQADRGAVGSRVRRRAPESRRRRYEILSYRLLWLRCERSSMTEAVAADTVDAGDHACLTFTDAEERWDLVAAFVRDGLKAGSKVV